MKTKCANGNTVNNWYDRKTRSSVVQVLDAGGNQIGDADYSGNRVSARFSKAAAIRANGGLESQSIIRRIARDWMSQRDNPLDLIVAALRRLGPMNADQLKNTLAKQHEFSTIKELSRTMAWEDARDWRVRRLRKATGYPDGYFISFDNNAGRD